MPIAGPVFTEGYRTPIFLVIAHGPPVAPSPARWIGWRRRTRAVLALVLAPGLVIGGVAVAGTVAHRAPRRPTRGR